MLLVAVWFALNLIESPIGRALRSVHGSEVAASVVGVNTTKYKSLVFVISAIYASLMGSLYAHFQGFITPQWLVSNSPFFSSPWSYWVAWGLPSV